MKRQDRIREKKEKLRKENVKTFGNLCYNIGFLHKQQGKKLSFEDCLREIESGEYEQ